MREGYGYGSAGILVSGLVWLNSGITATIYSQQWAIWTLIIGGALIMPIATLLEKLMGIKGVHDKNNPLGKLAMEVTIWMLMCIPLAYGLSFHKSSWFFQGMLLIIGGRYLSFASIYGLRFYWLLGAALGLAAYILFFLNASSFSSALTGGLIEIVFSILMYGMYRQDKKSLL